MARISPRARYKKSAESRESVLDAAIVVLARKGIGQTSVQDIADGAGLSKGAIHYHFDSKADLLVCVLDRCCEIVEAQVRETFTAPGTPIERIQRALREMWRVRREGQREMRVITDLHVYARQNKPIRKAFATAAARARQQIIDVGVTQLIEMGLKPKYSISVIPRLLLATLDGLALHQEVDPVSNEEEGQVLEALQGTAMALFEL